MDMEKRSVVTEETPVESEKIAAVVDEGVKAFEKKCSATCTSCKCQKAAKAVVKSN